MDVNNVMSTYNMSSIWNSISPLNTSSTVPLISNLDSAIKDNYSEMNYSGQNTNTELQDIYQQVEPNYGIPLTYDQKGNFSIPSNTSLQTNGLTASDSNIISLLNNNNSATNNLTENIISQYTAMENGTFNQDISSILSTNPYNLYSTIDSLGNYQSQNLNTTI